MAGVADVGVYYPLGLAEVVAKANDIETTALVQAVVRAGGKGRHVNSTRVQSGG
jgi:hypothetical protein